MCKPQYLERIRGELASTNKGEYKVVQQLQHLNACMCGTFRLSPSVPSAGLEATPRGGLTIEETYVPDDTTVVVPQHNFLRGEIPNHTRTKAEQCSRVFGRRKLCESR